MFGRWGSWEAYHPKRVKQNFHSKSDFFSQYVFMFDCNNVTKIIQFVNIEQTIVLTLMLLLANFFNRKGCKKNLEND